MTDQTERRTTQRRATECGAPLDPLPADVLSRYGGRKCRIKTTSDRCYLHADSTPDQPLQDAADE